MSDFFYILWWWMVIFVIGAINIPIAYKIFGKYSFDKGYIFSKIIGVVLLSYIFLVLSTLKILPMENFSLVCILTIIAFVNLFIYKKSSITTYNFNKRVFFTFLIEEILFAGGLFSWSIIRGYFPDINGLEKFMDLGFVNSMVNGKYLPPTDMWFSGDTINYYWFGHLVTAILTKLTAIPTSITYNLMIATVLGFSLSMIFSLVFNLTQKHFELNKNFFRKALIAGLLSAFLVNLAGNFHTPYYSWKDGKEKYWYPDATRFIGYNPETNDKTIHEFPIYSYVVSDLHAHLLNLPFVILYITLMYLYFLKDQNKNIKNASLLKTRINNFAYFLDIKTWNLYGLVLLGFLLGIMFMTSTWDFGNYLIFTAIGFTLFNFHKNGVSIIQLIEAAIKTIIILILGLLFAIPFLVNFVSIAQGIAFTNSHSPLWQLLILWGFPLLLTILFLSSIFHKPINKILNRIGVEDIFILTLLVTTWILIILPEIIYVKDIYIASHHRANTMFKLTYQSFVLSYLSGGYIIIRFLGKFENRLTKLLLAIPISFILSSIFVYPKIAVNSYYRDLKSYQGLDGESWLANKNPDIYAAIKWLRKTNSSQVVILEAPGDSYTEYNVISSYTGMPTVSGWFVHEWLWRGDPSFPQKRVADINLIYTDKDEELTKSYLELYKVSYVIIGQNEKTKYPNINEQKFSKIGKVAFKTNKIVVYKVD